MRLQVPENYPENEVERVKRLMTRLREVGKDQMVVDDIYVVESM